MTYLVISFKPYGFSKQWDSTSESRTVIQTCQDAHEAALHIAKLDCWVEQEQYGQSFRHVTLTINQDIDLTFDDYNDGFFDKFTLPEVAVFIEGAYLARKLELQMQKLDAERRQAQQKLEAEQVLEKRRNQEDFALYLKLKEKYGNVKTAHPA